MSMKWNTKNFNLITWVMIALFWTLSSPVLANLPTTPAIFSESPDEILPFFTHTIDKFPYVSLTADFF